MSACGLVGDPVVDDVDVLGECLRNAPLGVADELLLALGAGDEVNNMARPTVHVTVDVD